MGDHAPLCAAFPLTPAVPPPPPPPHALRAVVPQVQYPDALPTMALDLSNIRLAAAFLSKTEIRFDLVSAVDELAAQVGSFRATPAHLAWLTASGVALQRCSEEVPACCERMTRSALLVNKWTGRVLTAQAGAPGAANGNLRRPRQRPHRPCAHAVATWRLMGRLLFALSALFLTANPSLRVFLLSSSCCESDLILSAITCRSG